MKPAPPPIHTSHMMRWFKQGFKRCIECDRCFCCRPNGLRQPCPATTNNKI